MKIVLSCLSATLIAGCCALTGCRGGSRSATPTLETPPEIESPATSSPSLAATPASPPQASPTFPPTPASLLHASGSLLFLRDRDLWLAKLDGSAERRLTTGSLGAGYAGSVRDATGHVELYYTSQVARAGVEGPPGGGVFTVYKQSVDGGAPDELFTFRGTGKQVEYSATNASVSPDRLYVAYSDEGGVSRYDLTRRTATRLLANVPCTADTPTARCHGYYNPSWSPRGDSLLVVEVFYEGAQIVGIDPLNPLTGVREFAPKFDYDAASWAPDGARMCLVPVNSSRAVRVVTPDGPSSNDLAPPLRTGLPVPDGVDVHASWCSWSGEGWLAMQYVLSTDPVSPHVAVFDGSAFKQDVPLPAASGARSNAILWLPDGSGFVMVPRQMPGTPDWESYVVLLDGTVRTLPFDAGRVLGVIP